MRYTAALALLAVGASANTIVIKRSMGGGSGPVQQNGPMGSTSDSVKQICLEAHNTGRRAVGASDLEWDDELAGGSAGWADEIADNMRHSEGSGYGENLAMNSNKDYRFMIMDQWFNECGEYSQNPGVFGMGTGHYTQCAWKQTTRVGCGVSRDGATLVCRYSPAGNMQGDFDGNVATNCPKDFKSLPVGGGTPQSGGSGYDNTSPTTPPPSTGGGYDATNPTQGGGYDATSPTQGGGSQPGSGYVSTSPSTGGKHRGSGGHRNRKPKHNSKPKPNNKPKPDTDCDENDNSGRPQKPKVYKAASPAPNNNYGHKSGQSPTPKNNNGGYSDNSGRPRGGQRPRPSNDDEDCDEEDQATRPRGGRRPSNNGGYRSGNQGNSPRPSNDYENDSDRDQSPRGGRGGSRGGDYDNSDNSGRGGSDYSRGSGNSRGGSGKGDEDCDES